MILTAATHLILFPFTVLQAAIILVAMASGKNIWQLKFWWKSSTNSLKEKLTWKIINNRMDLINSTSGSITCLSHFPSCWSETWHEWVNLKYTVAKWRVKKVPFGVWAFHVICHEVSSPLRFFVFGDWIFYGDHLAIKGRQKATFWKSELGALIQGKK